jgi:hypothetical protein
MTRYQVFLLPALAAAILASLGAFSLRPASVRQLPPPVSPAGADPAALALLDRAIDAVSPDRVAWLEAAVWQQARCDDFTYQACGRLLIAPGDRSRYDMNVRVGHTKGEMRMVSDGKTLWQSIRVGDDPATIAQWDLPVANDGTTTSTQLTQARLQFLQEHGFAGLAPLLRSLRQCLHNAHCQQQTWKGNEVYVISGVWPVNTAAFAAMPDLPKPRFQPRLCAIYLDARTLWLHRLEWWGSEMPNQPNSLLVQTEFRNPVINRPLPPQQCALEFTINLGT